MIDLLNWNLIYYKGGFILYRKFLTKRSFKVQFKLIYFNSITSIYIDDACFTLNDKVTLKSLISAYKEIIDGYNTITKNM